MVLATLIGLPVVVYAFLLVITYVAGADVHGPAPGHADA
jgi:hypothetical protein